MLKTGSMNMSKEFQKLPLEWGFLPFVIQKDLFYWGWSLLYPYGALNSCKKLEKTYEQSPRYLKADKGHYYGPHRVNPGSKSRTRAALFKTRIFFMWPDQLIFQSILIACTSQTFLFFVLFINTINLVDDDTSSNVSH